MFLMTEVTFSMAAALGMKDLTADYHLFQARDVGNSRVERKSVAFFFFGGGKGIYRFLCLGNLGMMFGSSMRYVVIVAGLEFLFFLPSIPQLLQRLFGWPNFIDVNGGT